MARHLNYNPGGGSIAYLEAITCGENRLYILEQLLISLRAEIGRPNHQHHLLIGPRGSGKTHLLRLLTAGRIHQEPALAAAYLAVVMPEEIALRSPGDLYLKFVERLCEQLREPPPGISQDAARTARGICMTALTTAKGIRQPLERLELMAAALDSVATTLTRIILPIAENMDQTFILGAQRSRTAPLEEHWALRRHLQETPHLFLIGAAPTIFGAVGDPGKPFYDFFRTHELQELHPDEALKIIEMRLRQDAANPGADGLRNERVGNILEQFAEKSPRLRGILAITGGLPRFIHLVYEVIVGADISDSLETLNGFLDDLTPYFQQRLDPRFIPQPEIDLLHTLALARGPQQPKELAEELYGVATNELSELLGRLQERGLVKRAGRPGGQAVTWDLTEPLYRVWTQFRDNPEGQDIFGLLGKFVADLYEPDLINRQLHQFNEELITLPTGHGKAQSLRSQIRILEYANEKYRGMSERDVDRVTDKSTSITGDLEQSRTQLEVLRKLSHNQSDVAVFRERLAWGLFNAFYDTAKAGDLEQSRMLLEELRKLSHTHDDAAVREQLARGLFYAFNFAKEAGDPEQCRTLLEELRQLSHTHANDWAVRDELARGIFNAFNYTKEAGDLEQSRTLLEELRQLSHTHSDDPFLRDMLAMGLANAINFAAHSGDLEQSRTLLEELRQLSHTHAEDAAVREQLAMGIFNASTGPRKGGNLEQSRTLLEELRQLSLTYADDAAIRELLAKGLFNAIYDAAKAGDLDQSRTLLKELRHLSRKQADDAVVRKMLASGLVNAINAAAKDGDPEQSRTLLEELRHLSRNQTDDAAVRELLAKGIFNASDFAANSGDLEQSRMLLEELRQLSHAHANEAAVREQLTKGIANASYVSAKAGDLEQSRTLLAELRQLGLNHADDASVREVLARGLFNAFNVAAKAGGLEQSRTLLAELFDLLAQHPLKSTENLVQAAVMEYGVSLLVRMKSGDTLPAKEGMRWLESRMPGGIGDYLRPIMLAMDVLSNGAEQALAREPEEMRRVVRMVLEKVDSKS